MKAQCVMCGQEIGEGILCERCDRPRRRSTDVPRGSAASATLSKPAEEEHIEKAFPKAPIVPFPIESTSLALTSIYEILSSAEVPTVLLGSDRKVRFASDDAKEILGIRASDPVTVEEVQKVLGLKLPEPDTSLFTQTTVHDTRLNVSVIPLSGGAAGTAILLRPDQHPPGPDLESLRAPLTAIRREIGGIAQVPRSIIQRLDDVISRMGSSTRGASIRSIYDRLSAEFAEEASSRKIRLQVDAPETGDTWGDAAGLQEALRVLLRNSLQYVPRGGQIVVGLRFLEHQGEANMLFFVMDNGPVVPEELREPIFRDGYAAEPGSSKRSGNDLAICRRFAERHQGQAWVESRTGKACTFFIRVKPDVQGTT